MICVKCGCSVDSKKAEIKFCPRCGRKMMASIPSLEKGDGVRDDKAFSQPHEVPEWEIVLWIVALPITIFGIASIVMAGKVALDASPRHNVNVGRIFGPVLLLLVTGFAKWTRSLFKRLFRRSVGTRKP